MDKNMGTILNIQRMSTEDGPGIRTTVFFKGCSLSCAWCHNPESISQHFEIQWNQIRCIGCGTCVKACTFGALSMTESGVRIDRNRCSKCLKCADKCPTLALEVKGEEWELNRLIAEVCKDRAYFEKSKGGVTVSGGEALLQVEFVSDFLKELNRLGVNTAVDTCGMYPSKALDMVMPYTDLVLYDLKLMDPELHKRYTGRMNDKILDNLLYIADMMRNTGKPKELWIRTPIIPGATAADENVQSIGKFITENIEDIISRWDLCTFNNLCRDKYKRMDIDWMFKDAKLMKKDEMEHLAEVAKGTGVNSDIVHWSGATMTEE